MELIRINGESNIGQIDLLVIRLDSAVTVGKILLVEGHKYQTTQVVLCLVLFFLESTCLLSISREILIQGTCDDVIVSLQVASRTQ